MRCQQSYPAHPRGDYRRRNRRVRRWGNGVECFFEKEQIWTFDGKGELLITIMSSLAQEEARGISEQIKSVFCEAFNRLISDRERYLAALEPAIRLLTDTGDLDKDAEILGERSAGLYAQMEALVADNARQLQNQGEYQRQFDDFNSRYEKVKSRLAEVTAETAVPDGSAGENPAVH